MPNKQQNSNKREMLYMSAKAGKTKVIKVTLENGEEKEYTLQHPGLREGVRLRGRAKDQFGNVDEEKLFDELMKHVIVSPKTTWDYWEENEGYTEVLKAATTFLIG
ncbi:hypothetical protein M4D55_23435 [Metabacillus idriensis]|uniref:hypothetical protein n=1 Tax=Metabacillus idriensis TaxID=324768 RepID=UPI00203CEE6F|nr:hypothetical protein [Metabacillus idriensis]MCM3598716.1 hypothetical protein [Metabacillus idriensis]